MTAQISQIDKFHESFKFYKNNRNTKFKEILEIDEDKESTETYRKVKLTKPPNIVNNLTPFERWKAFELTHNPGFIIIKNAISSKLEKELIKTTFDDFLKGTHKTNLSPYTTKEDIANIWEDYKRKDGRKNLLKKLRWITFGYHHNWDTKVYSEDNKSEVPLVLKDLASCLASCLGHKDFKSEAGIINIYHHDSSLAGHVDDSEEENNLPLISISLGCTAIFLIGGADKSTLPTALLLKSADVVLMSGPVRCCYHAVPCIIAGSYVPQDSEGGEKDGDVECDEEWQYLKSFLKQSRINFNIRQVTK